MVKKASSSVLIVAVVAVVALAGLVFVGPNAGTQGAQTIILPEFDDLLTQKTGRLDSTYADYDKGWELGKQEAVKCLANAENAEVTKCCKMACPAACATPDDDTCSEKCANVCQNEASKAMGSSLRTR